MGCRMGYIRRRLQRQRRKTIGLMSKNNRSVRAVYILVHFFGLLCKTTRNDHMLCAKRERTTVNFTFLLQP